MSGWYNGSKGSRTYSFLLSLLTDALTLVLPSLEVLLDEPQPAMTLTTKSNDSSKAKIFFTEFTLLFVSIYSYYTVFLSVKEGCWRNCGLIISYTLSLKGIPEKCFGLRMLDTMFT